MEATERKEIRVDFPKNSLKEKKGKEEKGKREKEKKKKKEKKEKEGKLGSNREKRDKGLFPQK